MTEAETNETGEPPGATSTSSGWPAAMTGGVTVVELSDPEQRLGDAARTWLLERARQALALLNCTGEARVRIVGDEEMSAAHLEYLGEAGTTDVITFDMSELDEAEEGEPGLSTAPSGGSAEAPRGTEWQANRAAVLDADILVCSDEAARQAAVRDHSVERELLLYFIHGVLHCLGHDDHDEESAARMHQAEDEVLEGIGVGRTYRK
jgi:probable rRNA maturation factor